MDQFFANLADQAAPERVASDRAFARARDRLRSDALATLNDDLLGRMGAAGMIPIWHGLGVVAADASLLDPTVRACHSQHSAARVDQRLFALYLPGAELTLHASVHGPEVSERQMLFEALDRLGPDDVLVLDRGYPAAWLVALLNARGIRFAMRCDNASGWVATRAHPKRPKRWSKIFTLVVWGRKSNARHGGRTRSCAFFAVTDFAIVIPDNAWSSQALYVCSMGLGDVFPNHPNWKMSETHRAFWELSPTVDHIRPLARDGRDTEDDLVTTSQLTNSAKANWLVEELGWALRPVPPSDDPWYGLVGWFEAMVEQEGPWRSESAIQTWRWALHASAR